MSTYSLDIFKLLSDIDRGNLDLWETLSEEEQKGFAPLIVMRWMSGYNDARQIIYLNELVNPVVFVLGKHPKLLMLLLTICSSKQPRRYSWLKQSGNKKTNKVSNKLIMDYYSCSNKEAENYLKILTDEDIIIIAENLGVQKDEMAIVKRELK